MEVALGNPPPVLQNSFLVRLAQLHSVALEDLAQQPQRLEEGCSALLRLLLLVPVFLVHQLLLPELLLPVCLVRPQLVLGVRVYSAALVA